MPGLETEGSKLAAQQAMHSQYVLQLLQLQRRAGFLCDITVNIQEKSFKAHKPLLAACSLYFRALFADTESSKTSTLNFEKLSANGFEVLLDYIYSGSLAITSENSDQVLHAANCLQMTNVVETCLNFIRSSFKATAGDVSGKISRPPEEKIIPPTTEIAETPRNIPHSAHVIPAALQPNVHDPALVNQTDIQNRRMALHGATNTQLLPEQISQNQAYLHTASSAAAFETPEQNHVAKPQVSEVQPSSESDPLQNLTQQSLINPSPETLSMLMPYLVAKNARRPTLNEVRQLLLSGQHPGASAPENEERFVIPPKQAVPALIPATEPPPNSTDAHLNATQNEAITTEQFPPGTKVVQESPKQLNMTVPLNTPSNSAHSTVGSNTTSHATVHAGLDLSSTQITSKELQPFVLMTSENNALMRRNSLPPVDGSKGNAWSDDRSVGSDQIHDRTATHLSGTPCTASLTQDGGGVGLHPYPATSPASFGSTPSIEISPESVTTTESPTEPRSVPKLRWSRAHSLDFPKQLLRNEHAERDSSKSAEDFRSSSLSPRFFGSKNNDNCTSFKQPSPTMTSSNGQIPGDHSSLISAEQAATAVCALFVGSASEKSKSSASSIATHSTAEDNPDIDEDSRLVIEEASDTDGQFKVTSGKTDESPVGQNDQMSAISKVDFPKSDHFHQSGNKSILIKSEPNFSLRTSPPPEDSLFMMEQEEELSHSSSSRASPVGNHDGTIDENGVLDLSMQKKPSTSKLAAPTIPPLTKLSVQTNFTPMAAPSPEQKAKEALDALVMMRSNSIGASAEASYPFGAPSNVTTSENNSLTAGYSRKPRRSSGGQTCPWQGCGRLFRHRNIFEEHVKLHKMGVPVKQLRRCYMGARVKKTARERLDEMRMTEGATSQTAEAHDPAPNPSNVQRVSNRRKRQGNPLHKEGTDRKRVTAKDRIDRAWQQHGSSHATIQHTPLYSHAPSIPLAVLQAVSSHSNSLRPPWPGVQSQIMNEVGGMQMNLLNYPAAGQVLPPALTGAVPIPAVAADARPRPQPMPQTGSNNPAVVETLAALGIPIPAKRDNEEPPVDMGASGVPLSPPTSALPLDQLRRIIGLRENAPQGDGAAVIAQPLQLALSSLAARTQQRSGNVYGGSAGANSTDNNITSSKSSNIAPVNPQLSVPNQYHVPHGSTCS